MLRRNAFLATVVLLGLQAGAIPASADEVLYRYDGDVLPLDPLAGWVVGNLCEPPCSESLEDGHFVLHWTQADDLANYHLWIARPPDAPPPTLWVEWRFRSNHPLGPIFTSCDGVFVVHYGGILDSLNMYGDAAISHSGNDFVTGLNMNDFHSYRFESLDGINYTIAVDGEVFLDRAEDDPNGNHYLQLAGEGGCNNDQFPNMINEWDHVWYGAISTGEQIVATDPPAGNLDPQVYADLDRFTVTFDSPNYVYLDDITVEVTGGTAPTVTQALRLDNGEPDVVEIVLDGPLALNERTRFIFDDGERVNVVAYTLGELPPVPTTSQWGIVVLTLLVLTAGTLILQRARGTRRNPVQEA